MIIGLGLVRIWPDQVHPPRGCWTSQRRNRNGGLTMLVKDWQVQRAELFARLHRPGEPLLLPNAWDVASAVTVAAAGAKAIATTSAGVAWSLGVPDGAGLGAERVAAVVARIVAAVDVPVSADIEAGYEDLTATVSAVLQAGAVGVNIEDSEAGALLPPGEQAGRLRQARAAADHAGLRLWINARTDVFLAGSGELDEALARSVAYAEAGADSLFVPGLVDPAGIAALASGPLPVTVMAWPGAPPAAELAAAGAVRISLGSAIAQAAYRVAARAAAELLADGTYDSVADGIDYRTMNDALAAAAAGREQPHQS
jgi:2-methylisocitrate lyase-like PEP mutase family enzyme